MLFLKKNSIMMKTLKFTIFLFLTISLVSCGSDDDGPTVLVLETFTLNLSVENEIPAVPGRTETGTAVITIFDNNTLGFTITVNNLDAADALTAAHIHSGDLVSSGDVIIGLVNGTDISFNGNSANGTIAVTDAQIASIQGNNVYLNVHSTNVPSGLVRAQLDQTITFSKNVVLSPANEVPVVTGRFETGWAIIRVNSDNDMYYRIIIENLSATDAITMAHIHKGDATENGEVRKALDITELNTSKTLTLTVDELDLITQLSSYINVHSTEVGSGLLRGQLVE
jgi:hypothetical protein